MKKLIYKIFLFVIIIVAFNVLYLKYLKIYDFGFSKTLFVSNMKNENFDCVILGHSVPLDGIDAGYLTKKGVSSYNFALGGANIEGSYIQLSKFIKSNKTKCVMLGLSPGRNYQTFVPPPLHPVIEYSYGLMDRYSLRSIPIIKFQWRAIEPIKKIFSKDHRDATVVLGQLRTKKTIVDQSHYAKEPKRNITIDDFRGAKYLFKLDSLCDANKIDLLLLSMPGYKSTQNEMPLGLQILNYDDGNELNFINLNNKYFCSNTFDYDKDWLGNSHLNEYGAEKLTKHLYKEYLEVYNSK